MSKPKILIFAHDASLYGASLSLISLLEGLQRLQCYSIHVLLPFNGPMVGVLNELNIRNEVVFFPRTVIKGSAKIRDIMKYYIDEKNSKSKIEKKVVDFNPDLIYTNTSAVRIGSHLAKKLKIKHIWHVREYFENNKSFSYVPSLLSIKRSIKKSSVLIFASEILKNSFLNSKDQNDAHVVYNCISFQNENEINLSKSKVERYKFGLIGYISLEKGHLEALEGFSILAHKYSNVELHFYGGVLDQNFYKLLIQKVKELKLQNIVHFQGYIENKRDIYQDLFAVLSCTKFLGVSRTILESMSFSKPVISGSKTGVEEIIKEGVNGLYYNNTSYGLYLKMNELIENKKLYLEISKNSFQTIKKNFTQDVYVMKIKKIIDNIL